MNALALGLLVALVGQAEFASVGLIGRPDFSDVLFIEDVAVGDGSADVDRGFASHDGVIDDLLRRRPSLDEGASRGALGDAGNRWRLINGRRREIHLDSLPGRDDLIQAHGVVRGRLSVVRDFQSYLEDLAYLERLNDLRFAEANVCAKLAFCCLPRDVICLKGKTEGEQHQDPANAAYPRGNLRPLGGERGGVSGFPLGAQIAVSLVVAALALSLIFRAMKPFGLLVIRRADILRAAAYGLSGLAMLGVSGWIWMLGG